MAAAGFDRARGTLYRTPSADVASTCSGGVHEKATFRSEGSDIPNRRRGLDRIGTLGAMRAPVGCRHSG